MDQQESKGIFGREPARIIGVVQAVLVLLVVFGVSLTTDQSEAVIALVAAVLSIVGGEAIRSRVSPVE